MNVKKRPIKDSDMLRAVRQYKPWYDLLNVRIPFTPPGYRQSMQETAMNIKRLQPIIENFLRSLSLEDDPRLSAHDWYQYVPKTYVMPEGVFEEDLYGDMGFRESLSLQGYPYHPQIRKLIKLLASYFLANYPTSYEWHLIYNHTDFAGRGTIMSYGYDHQLQRIRKPQVKLWSQDEDRVLTAQVYPRTGDDEPGGIFGQDILTKMCMSIHTMLSYTNENFLHQIFANAVVPQQEVSRSLSMIATALREIMPKLPESLKPDLPPKPNSSYRRGVNKDYRKPTKKQKST